MDDRAFKASLADLKQWREETSAALTELRRWALVHRLAEDQSAVRTAYLERRLSADRLLIAFVAERSRGKSELINALFFADVGARLLPARAGQSTLCPTEILHDPSFPPCIRLLPIGTRESPQALREFIAQPAEWTQVPLDPAHPAGFADALDALSESLSVPAAQANNLGYPGAAGTQVDIPRWRYAIVNFPHPLLEMGLTILDTPGREALASEPELSMHRLQEADAVVFMLSADAKAAGADLDLWHEHVEPMEGLGHTRYVVLNKIDSLHDGARSRAQVHAEIGRQVREITTALGVDPTQVFPLSARQGLVARQHGDGDALAKSGLHHLEQALAQGLVQRRRAGHAASVRAEVHPILAEARSLIESRRAFVQEQVNDLDALRGRNRKLVDSLLSKASGERARIEDARAALTGLRAVHNRHADALAAILDPQAARAAGMGVRDALVSSKFSAGIGGAIDAYFREMRGRIERAVEVIGEVKAMMATVNTRFAKSWGLTPVELAPFTTQRFLVELDRLEEHCSRDFRSTSSLLLRGRHTLAALFFDTVALKAVHVFEIADREVRAWMSSFIRPLEAQVGAFQEQASSRIDGMARMRDAESGLEERIVDLSGFLRECDDLARDWESHDRRIARLLDAGPAGETVRPR